MSDVVAAAPAYGPALRAEILDSFAGDIQPVAVPPLYRLGLAILAVAMVLLPIIYLGIVAGVAYGVYYHGTNNLTIFDQVDSGRTALLLYGGPLLVGVILVLFMIKPLFARAADEQAPRSLDRRREPLVFDFVERICAAVGAPKPKRIDVDCQVNASASFRRGWLSLASQDLVLTLGLPLVAGLNLQQMAGVLAHEFGHFAQGAGMRLTYVIRSVNFWFLRVVYERDAWDQQLEKAGKDTTFWMLTLVVNVARLMVWFTRRILWVLMWVGNVISCFMLRQMEFDADRYEARLVGGKTFESTCRELTHLGVSFQKSMSDLGATWQDGRLADSLPGLVRANRQRLDAEVLGEIRASIDESKTALLDTHPADRDRIANARREGERPMFRSTLPASVLFRDFQALSRKVSLDFYGANLGQDIDAGRLQPLEQMLAGQDAAEEEQKALGRFFQGAVHWLRMLSPEQPAAGVDDRVPDVGRVLQTLEAAREALLAGRDQHRERLTRYDEADTELLHAAIARGMQEIGMTFDPQELSLAGAELSDILDLESRARERARQAEAEMAPMEQAALARLEAAVSLLRLPKLQAAERPDLAELRDHLPALRAAAGGLSSVRDLLTQLRFELAAFGNLASQLQHNPENEALLQAIQQRVLDLQGRLTLRDSLAEIAYPFEHADSEIHLGTYLVPALPDEDNLGEVYEAVQSAVGRAYNLYFRIMGRLALIGEQLEAELGLEQLEPPPEPEETASGE